MARYALLFAFLSLVPALGAPAGKIKNFGPLGAQPYHFVPFPNFWAWSQAVAWHTWQQAPHVLGASPFFDAAMMAPAKKQAALKTKETSATHLIAGQMFDEDRDAAQPAAAGKDFATMAAQRLTATGQTATKELTSEQKCEMGDAVECWKVPWMGHTAFWGDPVHGLGTGLALSMPAMFPGDTSIKATAKGAADYLDETSRMRLRQLMKMGVNYIAPFIWMPPQASAFRINPNEGPSASATSRGTSPAGGGAATSDWSWADDPKRAPITNPASIP